MSFKLSRVTVSFLLISASFQLAGQSTPLAISQFTNGFEGWQPENPWLISSEDGMQSGDTYLRMPVGINSGNKGSKLIAFNPSEDWTGNFIAKGVNQLQLNFANWSETDPAYLRIALSNAASPQQSFGTWWVSNDFVLFPPESGWGIASFNIDADSMHRVGNLAGTIGLDTFGETLSDINGLRILSSTLGFASIGDEFYGVVGMDNIQLVGVPEPSQITLTIALLIGLVPLFLKNERRFRTPSEP